MSRARDQARRPLPYARWSPSEEGTAVTTITPVLYLGVNASPANPTSKGSDVESRLTAPHQFLTSGGASDPRSNQRRQLRRPRHALRWNGPLPGISIGRTGPAPGHPVAQSAVQPEGATGKPAAP